MDTLSSTLIVPTGVKMQTIDSHTAVLTDAKDKAYIFGGFIGCHKSNKVFEYTIAENKLNELNIAGILPPPRIDHSAVFSENQMIIFGGTDSEGEKLQDLWILDTLQNKWNKIDVSEDFWPRFRSGHSAIVHNKMMYIFGGSLGLMQEVNEMFAFDIAKKKWDLIHAAEKMITEADTNSPVTALKIKKMNEEAKRRQRGESVSPKDKIFRIRPEGGSVSPRGSPRTESPSKLMRKTFMKSKKAPVDPEYKRIEKEDEASSPVVALMKNSIVMKATSSDKKKPRNDLMEGSKMMVGKFPCGRDGHAAKVYNGKLYVFGGDRCQMAYNDLFAFPLQ